MYRCLGSLTFRSSAHDAMGAVQKHRAGCPLARLCSGAPRTGPQAETGIHL
jgi:hypothetical protein